MLADKDHPEAKDLLDHQDIQEPQEDPARLEVAEAVALAIIVHLHVHHQAIEQHRNSKEKTTHNRIKCVNKIWRFSSDFVHLKRNFIKYICSLFLECKIYLGI